MQRWKLSTLISRLISLGRERSNSTRCFARIGGATLGSSIVMMAILSIVSYSFLIFIKEHNQTRAKARQYSAIKQTMEVVEQKLANQADVFSILQGLALSYRRHIRNSPGLYRSHSGIFSGVTVTLSTLKGGSYQRTIRVAGRSDTSRHLITNKLYISAIDVRYQRKFETLPVHNINILNKTMIHAIVTIRFTFQLKSNDVWKKVMRTANFHIRHTSDSNSRTWFPLSIGLRMSRVMEDQICRTKNYGSEVGIYELTGTLNNTHFIQCLHYHSRFPETVMAETCSQMGGVVSINTNNCPAERLCFQCNYDYGSFNICPRGMNGLNQSGIFICNP